MTQATQDALADAETLLLNVAGLTCGRDAMAARQHGYNWLSGAYCDAEAIDAIRAAFRAVPELRG